MALWTPAFISTELWLDASDSDTITESGGAVSQWDDKSGNNRHAVQANTNYRPNYNITGFGGLPTVIFDGVNDGLVLSEFLNSPDVTLFLAGQSSNNTEAAHGQFFIDYGDDIHGNKSIQIRNNNSGLGFLLRDVDGNFIEAILPNTSDNFVAAARATGRIATLDKNGTQVTATNENYAITTWEGTTYSPFLGAFNALNVTSAELNGKISELFIVFGAVSDDMLNRGVGYLAHKWGLIDKLPVAHPYKDSAPAVYSLGNKATKTDGSAIDRVVVLDAEGQTITTVVPDETGSWSADITQSSCYLAYLSTGCAPIIHGLYSLD
jgi:hypothetical protein